MVYQIGQIIWSMSNVPPQNFIQFGVPYSGFDYPELFALVPDQYKNGTEFTLPDVTTAVIIADSVFSVGNFETELNQERIVLNRTTNTSTNDLNFVGAKPYIYARTGGYPQ